MRDGLTHLTRASPRYMLAMQIETPRLVLRPLRLDDADAMVTLLQDERVYPWVREDGRPTEGQVKRWIARKMLAWATGAESAFAVVLNEAPIGYVTVHAMDRPVQALSYAILPTHWRQGYATEAIQRILAQAHEMGVAELWARTHFENPPSAALLEALGFAEREPLIEPRRRMFQWRMSEG